MTSTIILTGSLLGGFLIFVSILYGLQLDFINSGILFFFGGLIITMSVLTFRKDRQQTFRSEKKID